MRVALSFDMEGVSQLTYPSEILAAADAYWQSGRPKLHRDVVAAAEGLLAAGADEVILLDNHGAGNPSNIGGLPLPDGVRLETWHLFELRDHGVDAQLQVGYHARGGIDGFISHTYVPGLRLRVNGEQISESHGRAWGAGVPLLGIVGNDMHEPTLGALAGTPYLVVQETIDRGRAQPRYADADEGYDAIRTFAEETVRAGGRTFGPPSPVTFEASLEDPEAGAAAMAAGGWHRASDHVFSIDLAEWREAREPLNAAMAAGFAPWSDVWVGGLTSDAERANHDPSQLAELERRLVEWAQASEPDWY